MRIGGIDGNRQGVPAMPTMCPVWCHFPKVRKDCRLAGACEGKPWGVVERTFQIVLGMVRLCKECNRPAKAVRRPTGGDHSDKIDTHDMN